jgi:glycosyltransferase involved in cell wall biosynthesis
MLRPVDAWVGITEAFRPRLRTAGIPAERFHCIYGGVDVERYRPVGPEERVQLRAELGLPADGRVVVSAGAVLPRKGFDRLLRAWHAMRPDPARDRLVIAGPATVAEGVAPRFAGHKAELERFVAEAGLGQSVRIIGRVDDLERWYAASDVFAFLSRREGMGYVIVEAMASGLPCVVSPLDGIGRELLREGLTGTVVEHPDDPEFVAARLRGLLDDPERRRAWGAAGREDALERFSLRSRARTMAELYRELAARGVANAES